MRFQRGLTLVELVMFIVVVSVGVMGILVVLNATARSSTDPMARKQVLAVAEAMMDEILAKDFANPPNGFSPATPGNPTQSERPSFDDISDYNMTAPWRWTGVRSAGDVATNITGLEQYTIAISVAGTTDLVGIPSADAMQITVTVEGGGNAISLVSYRTRYE